MATCPNKNSSEWKSLVEQVGEDMAYYLYDQSNGDVSGNVSAGANKILNGVSELFNSNPELANQVYEALGFKNSLSLEDILKEYKIDALKGGVSLRSLQNKIEEKDFDTIKLAYNYLKSEEKHKSISDSNEQIKSKLEKLKTELRQTKETKAGSVLTITNDENLSDYKVKVIEITKYNNYAILKVRTAKNKEYSIRVAPDGTTRTGRIEDFVFKAVNEESSASIIFEINNLKSQLQELKADYSDYYIDYFGSENQITPQQKQQALLAYSQYLDTVFPDSKVKDIVYHGTDFSKNAITFKTDRGGIFLASTPAYASYFSKDDNAYPALINFKNAYKAKGLTDNIGKAEVLEIKSRGYDSVIGKGGISKMQQHQNDLEYIAFEPEQIHILGSKQDIEGFKEFVADVQSEPEAHLGFQDASEIMENEFDLISSDPALYDEIVSELQRLYPDVKILENHQLPPGKIGVAMRKAGISAVFWSMTDGRLDTAPHEYAHHYIDWYRSHPLVQKGIQKYGEEKLVTMMGKAFVRAKQGNPLSKSAMDLIMDIWEAIRSFFGHPSVAKRLQKAFMSGEKLMATRELSEMAEQFQTGATTKERIKTYAPVAPGMTTEEAVVVSVEDALEVINDSLASRQLTNLIDKDESQSKAAAMREVFSQLKERLMKASQTDAGSGSRMVYSNIIAEAIIKDVENTIMVDLTEAELADFFDVLQSTDPATLQNNATNAARNSVEDIIGQLVKMYQAMEYAENMKDNYILDDQTIGKAKYINSAVSKEAKDSLTGWQKALQNSPIGGFIRKIQKLSLNVLNPKFVAKELSGSFDSVTSHILYKAFDHGVHRQNEYYSGCVDVFRKTLKIPSLDKWGAPEIVAGKRKGKITDFQTMTFGIGSENITLTKDEAVSLYMNLIQKESYEAMTENGFMLTDKIDGRTNPSKALVITEAQAEIVIKQVEADKEIMEYVGAIKEYFDYQHEKLNPVWRTMHGFDMEMRDNYYPIVGANDSPTLYNNEQVIDSFNRGLERLDRKAPLGISSSATLVKSMQDKSSIFYGYGVAVNNAKKLLRSKTFQNIKNDKKNYPNGEEMYKYFESFIARIQNPSNMYPNMTDREADRFINKLMSNYSMAILGWNIPVMFKQPVSYINAGNYINSKYLKKTAPNLPAHIFKSLALGKKGDSQLLVSWVDTNSPTMDIIAKHSPTLKMRTLGFISREQGEIAQGRHMPYGAQKGQVLKLGPLTFNLERTMKGIAIFDAATVISIWKAVELETQDLHPGLKKGSDEYYERVAARTEQIVADSQPTYDQVHRSPIAASKNPILRGLTMFSSQPQKNLMTLISRTNDYIKNPTSENRNRVARTYANILVKGALGIALIDTIKGGILGYDDDDDKGRAIAMRMVNVNMSTIPIVGQIYGGVVTRLDDAPWTQTAQHPAFQLINDVSKSIADIISKDPDKSIPSTLSWIFQLNGVPVGPMKQTIKLATPE